jgi:hypothetical protein
MTALADFYRQKAEDFLKTVVCFDDQAYECAQTDTVISKAARKSPDGFHEDDSESGHPAVVEEDKVGEDVVAGEGATEFDAKDITDAFAELEILCSVIKPDTDGARARSQIEKMARMADVAIVDWELLNQDTSIARDAIINIVREDDMRGGCLRLIVIYSDGNGPNIIGELSESLGTYGFISSKDKLELQNAHSLIVFFQKPQCSNPTAPMVDYKDLPKRVVDSFTKLTSGLLPAAALSAISVIRQHSHHLLATFPATLDGAFLTHRCLIPDPSDAEQFLLDLFEGEIGSLLAHSKKMTGAVDETRCAAWVEKSDFFDAVQKKCLKKALTKCSRAKIDGFRKLFDNKELPENAVAEELLKLFYGTSSDPKTIARVKEDFSILSTLDVHRRGITTFDRNPPRLRLGSIVRETDFGRFLLCIQPLCDSTRIKHNRLTIFPFLILAAPPEPKDLDLCIPDEDEVDGVVWLSVLPKPQHLISYQFCGKSVTEAYVEAKDMGNQKDYAFQTSDDKCLEWMADLKPGKAQRIVSQLAARIHTLGIDEFEWLRLHGPRTS